MTAHDHRIQSQEAMPDQAGYVGVRSTLEDYFRGHATGDAAYMRQAFLTTAHIEGIREGVFSSWTLDEYCALFTGTPADDEATRRRSIDLIDISGTAASAK